MTSLDILEGPTELFPDEHIGPVPLPCPVFSGYVVLLESAAAAPTDLRNWSDVVAFTTAGPAQPGAPTDHYWYISDGPVNGVESGITPADLGFAGLTAADILSNPFTVFVVEGLDPAAPDINLYPANGPAGPILYRIHSDPPEPPTPAANASWGQLKVHYR